MKTITYSPTFNDYKINASEENQNGCYTSILTKIQKIIENALSLTSQIQIIRFDVRYPDFYPRDNILQYNDNTSFQGFLENYIRYLTRLATKPLYLWCTEIGKKGIDTGKLHHHVFILIDANVLRRMPNLDKASELWNRALNLPLDHTGLISRCWPFPNTRLYETKGIAHREDFAAIEHAFYWCSYCAKIRDKNLPPGVRSFGCSQI